MPAWLLSIEPTLTSRGLVRSRSSASPMATAPQASIAVHATVQARACATFALKFALPSLRQCAAAIRGRMRTSAMRLVPVRMSFIQVPARTSLRPRTARHAPRTRTVARTNSACTQRVNARAPASVICRATCASPSSSLCVAATARRIRIPASLARRVRTSSLMAPATQPKTMRMMKTMRSRAVDQ